MLNVKHHNTKCCGLVKIIWVTLTVFSTYELKTSSK